MSFNHLLLISYEGNALKGHSLWSGRAYSQMAGIRCERDVLREIIVMSDQCLTSLLKAEDAAPLTGRSQRTVRFG